MKFTKVALATTVLVALAGAASAQVVATPVSTNKLYFQATEMNITSATAKIDVPVTRPRSTQTLFAQTNATAAITLTITKKLADGTVVGVSTMSATSATDPVSLTIPAPLPFESFNISASALTGTNYVSVTQVQAQTTAEH